MRNILLALGIVVLFCVPIASAQTGDDPTTPGFGNLAAVLAATTIIAKIFGDLGRLIPFIPNVVAPRIAWFVAFIANVQLVADTFIRSSGLDVAFGVTSDVSHAGFGAIGLTVLKYAASAAIAVVQTKWLRDVHENGNKFVFPKLLMATSNEGNGKAKKS